MKIKVICGGKLRDKKTREIVRDYISRIRSFVGIELIEIEKRKIGKIFKENDFVVIMDEGGIELNSVDFASFLKGLMLSDKNICFVVGDWQGLDEEIKRMGDKMLSLSKMTFPYQLAVVLLLEQIYRALTIIEGVNYHK